MLFSPSGLRTPATPLVGFSDERAAARIVAVLMIFAGLADAATTEIGLRYAQVSETNPVVLALRDGWDVYWILFKMAGHGLIAYAVIRRPTSFGIAAIGVVAAGTIAVAVNNYALLVGDFARVLSDV